MYIRAYHTELSVVMYILGRREFQSELRRTQEVSANQKYRLRLLTRYEAEAGWDKRHRSYLAKQTKIQTNITASFYVV